MTKGDQEQKANEKQPASDQLGNPLFFRGHWLKMYAFRKANNSVPVMEYLQDEKEVSEGAFKALQFLFGHFDSKQGQVFNRTKVKKLLDYHSVALWEFKHGQIRIGWMWSLTELRTIYLLHAFTKKSDDWPPNHLSVLKNLCDLYMESVRKIGGSKK